MRERWGTFSVRDHVCDAPFVTEVLRYDRLIIPIPDPTDPLTESEWARQGWEPKALHECLQVLRVKTDHEDDLALRVKRCRINESVES
jgi:hypothetical protein